MNLTSMALYESEGQDSYSSLNFGYFLLRIATVLQIVRYIKSHPAQLLHCTQTFRGIRINKISPRNAHWRNRGVVFHSLFSPHHGTTTLPSVKIVHILLPSATSAGI